MRLIIILSVFIIATFSCTQDDGGLVHIRISNVSNYDYEDVFVIPYNEYFLYGNIKSGDQSDYHAFEMAFRYAYVQLTIASDTAVIQPIDFVGETPLTPGFYTYQIDASDTPDYFGRLSLELIDD